MLNRRQLLQAAGAGAATLALAPVSALAREKAAGFTLPKLPYEYDALEPHIDAETMKIHHDRHHKAYVDGLNKALEGQTDLLKMNVNDLLRNLDKVPEKSRQAVVNMGGGHANHTLFWTVMGPKAGGQPSGALAKAIDDAFESFDKFQSLLATNAMTQFGSGWAWLVAGRGGKLEVVKTPNQNSPLLDGKTPILGIDVWEHAYYLKYQNKRADYVKAWWNVVNWKEVGERLASAGEK